MVELTAVESGGLYRLVIPSGFPTGDTLCYLGESSDGWAVIDAGTLTDHAREIWSAALRQLGISFRHIRRIHVTHNHPDHLGLAGWLQQESDAEVYLSAADQRSLAIYALPFEEQFERVGRVMIAHGIAESMACALIEDIQGIMKWYLPLPEFTTMPEEDLFELGDDLYRTLPAPGHSDGHVLFLGDKHGRLFSGDGFLQDRVSQVSDWPYTFLENPLQVHLDALKNLADLPISKIYPGHGPAFTEVCDRLSAVEQHHNRRLNKVRRTLTETMDLAQLCTAINVVARVPQEFRVSWADTRAYLEYLSWTGEVDKRIAETVRYQPVK